MISNTKTLRRDLSGGSASSYIVGHALKILPKGTYNGRSFSTTSGLRGLGDNRFYEPVMITFISKDATYMISSEFLFEVFRHVLHVIRGASVARDVGFYPDS